MSAFSDLHQLAEATLVAALATQRQPPVAPTTAPTTARRLWLVRHDDGAWFSHSFTPTATEAEVRDWYPQAEIKAELEEKEEEEPGIGVRLADDRITCRQCRHLSGRRCQAAARRELAQVAPWHEPDPARHHACYGYLPLTNDTDQRPGAERWPSLAWMRPAAST